MSNSSGIKMSLLAASVVLAMAATAAMAADPGAGQLPGQGKVTAATAPTVTVDNTLHTMGIVLGSNTVINWGAGTGAEGVGNTNSTGTAGFNIGKGATVTFSGAFGALNIDSSGNPSQIFGTLNGGAANVFVANTNGIIVGATGVITTTGSVGLVANTLIDTAANFNTAGTLVNYQGTGGNVTVLKGATASGTLLISGGGTVNVDMTNVDGSALTVSAGLHGGANPLAVDNKSASAMVTGASGGSTLDVLNSAGTATTNGALTVGTNGVAGVLTNNGQLTLPVANGAVVNQGQLTTSAVAADFGSLTNNGTYNVNGTSFTVTGGNLTNNGSIAGTAYSVLVTNGSIVNNGTMTDVMYLTTVSGADFKAGATYSITNAGTISGSGSLNFDANSSPAGGAADDTTGNFTNTGTLTVGGAGGPYSLSVDASGDIALGGTLKAGTKVVSATNPLDTLDLESYNGFTNKLGGVVTLSTPVVFSNWADIYGNQVKIMANLSDLGDGNGDIDIEGGDKMDGDYAIRVASGVTVSANWVALSSYNMNSRANVILQGTVAGHHVQFGWDGAQPNYSVSDVFTGPNGGIEVANDGVSDPSVSFHFSGAIKTAPYLNNANNFRYNYLPITSTDGSDVTLVLDPIAYATNGTTNGAKSAVNILVNGGNTLLSQGTTLGAVTPISGVGSAVTGVLNVPNTHLVVQSTGDITTDGGSYYWPGYVYLGNISADADGNALPGTLGLGTISLDGNFSNVLPGDIAGASGIHFITQFPLTIAGSVTTNATAWVNLGTDLLTQKYSTGQGATGPFFGGTQGSGSVVNYGVLSAANFVTQAPDANK